MRKRDSEGDYAGFVSCPSCGHRIRQAPGRFCSEPEFHCKPSRGSRIDDPAYPYSGIPQPSEAIVGHPRRF